MQKKDIEVVEIATYVFTCDGCGDELHIKKAHSEEDALERVSDSGWILYNVMYSSDVLCQRCNRRIYGDGD